MIYGLALAHRLGLLEGWTAYYFGNMEEWCDGIAPHALVEHEGIRPDFVVIGEPTKMQVYRGHKGRVEIESDRPRAAAPTPPAISWATTPSTRCCPSSKPSASWSPTLGDDPFLGHGKITVTDMKVETPSINAVPDLCKVYMDRRADLRRERPKAPSSRFARWCRNATARNGDITVEMMQLRRAQLHRLRLPG